MKGLEFVLSEDFTSDIKILEEFLTILKIDFILIPDSPLNKPSASSLVGAKMISDALGIKTIATFRGGGKSKECMLSLLKGAEYAKLGGIACVSGDLQGWLSAIEVLELAEQFEFEFKICTLSDLKNKIKKGATHAITQPIFNPRFSPPLESIPILPNIMPIFSHTTFEKIAKNKAILGFEIPKHYEESQDLFQSNQELLGAFEDFYLTPLNLKKQMKFFKEIFASLGKIGYPKKP